MERLTASEALYGFFGWLTSREEKTVMSICDDCVPIVNLTVQFCEANGLEEPREGWADDLIRPDSKDLSPCSTGNVECQCDECQTAKHRLD